MRRSDQPARVCKRRVTFNEPGHAHELTFSCHRHLQLLSRDRTRQWLVESLDLARQKWDFELWAYVIMPEHVHLLLLPRQAEYEIAAILKAIKQSVARRAIRFLRRDAPDWLERVKVSRPAGRVEHRFWQQGGGYDRNIHRARTAWASVRYMHENPVRRGLVARPVDWVWSSARWYAGLPDVKLEMDDRPPDPPPG